MNALAAQRFLTSRMETRPGYRCGERRYLTDVKSTVRFAELTQTRKGGASLGLVHDSRPCAVASIRWFRDDAGSRLRPAWMHLGDGEHATPKDPGLQSGAGLRRTDHGVYVRRRAHAARGRTRPHRPPGSRGSRRRGALGHERPDCLYRGARLRQHAALPAQRHEQHRCRVHHRSARHGADGPAPPPHLVA